MMKGSRGTPLQVYEMLMGAVFRDVNWIVTGELPQATSLRRGHKLEKPIIINKCYQMTKTDEVKMHCRID